jgi:hypothetical protein
MAMVEIRGQGAPATGAGRPSTPTAQTRREFGLARLGFRMLGAALMLAAFGVWTVPAAFAAPSLLLMKLGLSVLMLSAGLGMMVSTSGDRARDATCP